MGAGQSTSSEAHPPSRALHVLRVTPLSPASQTSIEPFFDFVVGFEGDSLSQNSIDASVLERIVEGHEGKILNLLVWSSKSRETRVVSITPSRAWSLPHSDISNPQEPETEPQPSLLGLSMRMCEPEYAVDNVWHVLDVLEGSPAESAGLVPYGDWIIGWSGGILSAEGDFYDLVEAHVDKPLRVYVYSFDFDTLREVVLVPNRQWGGEGLLGCVFGFGLLHRIPPQSSERQSGEIPLELREHEHEVQDLFVPADVARPTPDHVEDRRHLSHHNYHHDHDDHSHDGHSQDGNDEHYFQDERTLTHHSQSPPPGPSRAPSWITNSLAAPRTRSFVNGTTSPLRHFENTHASPNVYPDTHQGIDVASDESGSVDGAETEGGSETYSYSSLTSVD